MTGALSVTVFPASYAEFIPQRAEVVLTGTNGTNTFTFPTYYVSSRAVNDNKDKKQIEDAVTEIISNFDSYSKACRERFLSTFFYRNYNEQLHHILSK